MISFAMADRDTWKSKVKRVDGDVLRLVAVQKSRRTRRKGRTKYVFSRVGTNHIMWNRSRNGVMFMPFANNDVTMKKYHEVFVEDPVTPQEKTWLARYDYELVK